MSTAHSSTVALIHLCSIVVYDAETGLVHSSAPFLMAVAMPKYWVICQLSFGWSIRIPFLTNCSIRVDDEIIQKASCLKKFIGLFAPT